MTTGEKIRAARKSKGMTLAELAAAIGVTASAVSQYERGKLIPSTITLLCISNTLGLPMSDLLSDSQLADIDSANPFSQFSLKHLMDDPCFALNISNKTRQAAAQKGVQHYTMLQKVIIATPDDKSVVLNCEEKTLVNMSLEEVSALCTLYKNLNDAGRGRALCYMSDLLQASKFRRETFDAEMSAWATHTPIQDNEPENV